MAVKKIWHNDAFWFRMSVICVSLWLVFSLAISLIIYFSWIHHFEAFHEMLVEFSTWFFLLPAIGIFGVLNSVPFVAPWLLETIEQEMLATEQNAPIVNASYKNLTDRLKAGTE